ncbi:hypothetical protein GCM10027414_04700 [Humibacter ginsengiterrae]
MIQLEHLHIEDFRGIRMIDLPLGSKPFVVYGPNGSGKSGVVDAIDFALTGSISRLSGAGTAGVTLLRHGPHVHKRDDPAAAVVELTVRDVETGEQSKLRRSIKDSGKFTLTPDTPSVRASVAEAQTHPELTLSRREIIKYVVAKPADRAQQVQALLKLDHLDAFRKLLKSVQTKTSAAYSTADAEQKSAENGFAAHLGIGQLLASEIVREIDARRQTLSLDTLDDLTIDTDLAKGLKAGATQPTFNLVAARREVRELVLAVDETEDLATRQDQLAAAITSATDDPTLLDALKHRQLVEAGLRDLVDATCPLCDREWESVAALKAHLVEKLARSDSAVEVRTRLTTGADQYKQGLKQLKDLVDRVTPVAKSHGNGDLHHHLTTYSDAIANHAQSIGTSTDTIIASGEALAPSNYEASQAIVEGLRELESRLASEPDQSALIDAQSFLTVAQDRWSRIRIARAGAAKAKAVRDTAKLVYDQFCVVSDDALKTLYETVEADFSKYYQIINADDEGNFTAQLKPTSGSLELEVDFYGQGKFPPTAYHSEGHQDGMGVCLYLALVKQLLGDQFRYAVLDDVVMSVDVNHRAQFCKLLKTEFPNVQFIITTHDPVWARQMQSAGLITSKAQARFYGWTVDGGPVYEQGDVWERIDEDLAKEDVFGAAHKLRRRLEAAAADIADSIGGRVPYRGDNNYDPSVLLDAVRGRHSDLLKMAAHAANSWTDQAAIDAVEAKKAARTAVVPEQLSESWIVNPLVHNNDWINTASVSDFKPVLKATKDFLDLFTCDNPDCAGWIYVVGRPEESLRCACGNYNLNLKKK